ncbi:pyridoxamine 5'-phosphate oxidase [Frigoriflavimonas asaccharolytica]|uniref:Pyridoxine/pyridoxamine 5'-phosphate oxidase n=1 Tax=Frigoriflavimonas asaccharolytica TaxID=2735899 RepID=A0A8J8G7K4_9FLAO|nr:pyridoxamine 5'-phosphate oxidase [Frigoriflavimonas asaccharolytica]NRS92633.1 pyridoxamine 5'-phosphate oxidase [Frigoriflavimonas asaccharolytica]
MENLHHHRKSYEKNNLVEDQINENPLIQFQNWFDEAKGNEHISEANAMSVSTMEEDGCPRIRTVLLKSYSEEGFIFYTNYESKKGESLDKTQLAGIQFFWPSLERQIIIKARVERVSQDLSDSYFNERPRGSQLGAIVSPQSSVIENRQFLEDRLHKLENEYEGKNISRPENWGGYIAKPYEIEFWQGRPNRLHDRILYKKDKENSWSICRLAP